MLLQGFQFLRWPPRKELENSMLLECKIQGNLDEHHI